MQKRTVLTLSLIYLLLVPKHILAQVVTNPFTLKEEQWLIKKGFPLDSYKWGSNIVIQTELYSILKHRKQSRNFLIATAAVGIVSAIYVSNNSEGIFYQVFMVPLGTTSLVHFIIGRHKIKKLRKIF